MKKEVGFFETVEARRSVRVFDQITEFDHAFVQHCLETAILSPNSSNMQLYNFVRVPETSTLKDPLAKLCMSQKAATTARELVVLVTRRDLWKSRAKANYDYIQSTFEGKTDKKINQALAYYSKLVPTLYRKFPGWSMIKKIISFGVGLRKPMVREVSETAVRISVHKSAALASMTFMLALKAGGYDSCPMEGFDSVRVSKLLGLPAGAEICMIIGCGKGLPDGVYGKRFRIPSEELISQL